MDADHKPIPGGRPQRVPLTDEERDIADALIDLYRRGVFPMADPDTGQVGLFRTIRRAVIPLDPGGLHIPRRLARTARSGRFLITHDAAFDRVVAGCAAPRTPSHGSESVSADTWINDELAEYYSILHRSGHAHSVEAWLPVDADDARSAPSGDGPQSDPGRWRLVAGIFGVCAGRVFCAESKFHAQHEPGSRDSSKVVLVALATHLQSRGFDLIDTQLTNPHLEQFGCHEIEAEEYERVLGAGLHAPAPW